MFPPPSPKGGGESSRKRGGNEYLMRSTRSKKLRTQTGDVVDLGDDDDDFCEIDNYTCDNDTSMKAEGE